MMIDPFTRGLCKERLCGQQRLGKATGFSNALFTAIRQGRWVILPRFDMLGHGLVIKNTVDVVTEALNGIDWRQYSDLAAHNRHPISMSHICQALRDCGFNDGRSISTCEKRFWKTTVMGIKGGVGGFERIKRLSNAKAGDVGRDVVKR
ncbi:MAG: hypothetical protein V6Z86_02450 [Hyphomicrobiales bacterium]